MNQQIIRRGKIKTPPTKEVIDNIVAPNLKDAIGRTFWAYVDLNRAHVLMLAEQGIISKETEKAILKVNEELAQMGERPTFEIDPRRDDLDSHTYGCTPSVLFNLRAFPISQKNSSDTCQSQ